MKRNKIKKIHLYKGYYGLRQHTLTHKQFLENFTFNNYKEFCKDFKIKESDYNNLKTFKMYCRGRYEVLFSIL